MFFFYKVKSKAAAEEAEGREAKTRVQLFFTKEVDEDAVLTESFLVKKRGFSFSNLQTKVPHEVGHTTTKRKRTSQHGYYKLVQFLFCGSIEGV